MGVAAVVKGRFSCCGTVAGAEEEIMGGEASKQPEARSVSRRDPTTNLMKLLRRIDVACPKMEAVFRPFFTAHSVLQV